MTERARRVMLAAWLLLLLGWPWPGEAHVVRLRGEQKRVVADGKSFGDAGPYERLDGTVYIEVDPRDPLNGGSVNLDKAPRTPKGMVGFTSPFFILLLASLCACGRDAPDLRPAPFECLRLITHQAAVDARKWHHECQ